MPEFSRSATLKIIYVNLACALLIVGLAAVSVVRKAHALDELIVRVSRANGMDPRLVSAVIWKESRFNPQAKGKAGEVGLMQVMPVTGMEWAGTQGVEGFTPERLFDPETNLRAGVWYLRKAVDEWSTKDNPLPYALAQYNAGRRNVLKWDEAAKSDEDRFMENITFEGTFRYISDIVDRFRD
ncbi:MAG: lytic transglycosylase domain-containing protein [Kiritimatiellia bacterium]